jgi:DNA polymerase III epsilon subunit-like protein
MKALVFDTETTGLVKNRTLRLDQQPEIIEWYSCIADLKTGKTSRTCEFLVRPTKPISAEITKITGITNEMVANMSPMKIVGRRFISEVEKADVVIGHNVRFDMDMLEIEAERYGWKVKWPRVICTIEQTIHVKGFRLNLNALHQECFGTSFSGAHRAGEDVQALVRCCVHLHKQGLIA